MQVHGITLLLNDKQDEIPSRIYRECQFYSQSENTNAKYMTIQDCIRKVYENYSIWKHMKVYVKTYDSI